MLGNATFTSVHNLAAQLPELNVANLTAANADIVGFFKAPDGTPAAPSYSFTDHPDSGMYFNSVGPPLPGIGAAGVAIATNGVNRFEIGGNGNASLANSLTVSNDVTVTAGDVNVTAGSINVVIGGVNVTSGNVRITNGQLNTINGGEITSGKALSTTGKGLRRACSHRKRVCPPRTK